MTSPEAGTKPTPETDAPEIDREDTIRRIEALVTRSPGLVGVLIQFVDLIEEVDLDERLVNQIEILCEFCNKHPELALYMAAIGTMRQ